MLRDRELLRDLLLRIEAEGGDRLEPFDVRAQFQDRDPKLVSFHVWLLKDAGFVVAVNDNTLLSDDFELWDPCCLTWRGFEFLDTIKDGEIWKKTKQAAARGGSASIEFMWKIAQAYVSKQLKEKAGIDIPD